MTGAPPLLDATTIRTTRIFFDSDSHFVVEFDNYERSYALIVSLGDPARLSFRETRAIADAVKLAARGTAIDNSIFFSITAKLRDKYTVCEGPVVENDRLVALLDPSHIPYNAAGADAIVHVGLEFDHDDDLCVTAHTQGGIKYSVILAIHGTQNELSSVDCNAIGEILALLEPGERVNLTDFLCHLAYLRETYGFIRLGKRAGAISCLLFASNTSNNGDEMPKQIKSALEDRDRRQAAAEAESAAAAAVSIIPAHNDPHRPPSPPKPHQVQPPPDFPPYADFVSNHQTHPNHPPPLAGMPPQTPPPLMVVQTPPPSPMPHCPYPDMVYERALTESGQAQVYSGKKLSTREKVAIKVFLGTGNAAGSTFRLELRMLLKMPEHPNVISVLDFFEYPRPALVTRLIEGGGDMLQHLRQHGAMKPDDAKIIAAELAEGVLHLHRSGIVHRDLKSANVLLKAKADSRRLTPVIIDLGLGAAQRRGKQPQQQQQQGNNNGNGAGAGYSNIPLETEDELGKSFAMISLSEKTQGMKGTPFWMAPEMIRSQEWSEKTDVFAFGIILWEMLSGCIPYSHIAVRDQWDLLTKIIQGIRPDITKIQIQDAAVKEEVIRLVRLIERCWSSEAKLRPTMMQVVDELRGSDPEAIFKSVDLDGSRSLDFPELVGFLGRYAPEIKPGEMYPIFQGLDSNDSGAISFKEFLAFWTVVTQKGIHVALKDCQGR